jgi:hypothetical protein
MPRRLPLALLATVLAAGCTEKPKAPPLTNDAVYQNDKIGLRFLVPEGWVVSQRAELPPGSLAKPVVLAAYQNPKGERPTDLEVLAADLSPDDDTAGFLAEHNVGPDKWAPAGPAAGVTINGVTASRHVLVRQGGKEEYRREATVFRRGGRVYVFLIAYAAADPASRDAARKAVESAAWKE